MSLPTPAQGEPDAPPVDVLEKGRQEPPVETPHTPVEVEKEVEKEASLEPLAETPHTPVVSETPPADIHIDITHSLCRKQETLDKIAKMIEDLQSLHNDLKNHS